ncbi:MAG: gamma carbonic anhydrase family protein, partial [Pseudomonadota bacterium]
MPLRSVRGKTPEIAEGCWLAPSAEVIGDVRLGRQSSVWFHVTIRGDVMPIRIGEQTNIQDGCTL